MPKMSDIADRMYYWCAVADLGYDQGNRWDIRDGGETDCSALVLECTWEVGYMPDKPTWGNTDTMWSQLEPLGFKRVVASKSNPPKGVIRLRNGHTAVSMGDGTVAQASIDENGKITGGQGGDQTGRETNISKDPNNWIWDIYAPDAPSNSNATQDTTGGIKVYGFPTVSRGSTGDAVKVMQAVFNVRFGYSLAVDGSCGPVSSAAIVDVQTRLGLDPDGYCGPKTWQAILTA